MRIEGRYVTAMLTYFKSFHFLMFTTANCLITELFKFAENDTVKMIDFFLFFPCLGHVRPLSFSDLVH